MRRTIPVAIAFVVGSGMVLDYFFKIAPLNAAAETVRGWVVMISIFALGLGSVNLMMVHQRRIRNKSKGSPYSVVLIVSFVVTLLVGLAQGPQAKAYRFIFNSMCSAPGSTIYAMLAFFISSAAYRAFRARNAQAAVLLVSAVIVMLGNVPIGEVMSPYLPQSMTWLMNVPNVAGQRGIMVASSLGFMAISFKIIMGYSREYLGGGE